MTEKRSEYRKKNKLKKSKGLLNTIKSAFDDNEEEVDVNPDFTRTDENNVQINQRESEGRRQQLDRADDNEKSANSSTKREVKNQPQSGLDKGLRLKKKLNHAIVVVLILIILVLLALFHL